MRADDLLRWAERARRSAGVRVECTFAFHDGGGCTVAIQVGDLDGGVISVNADSAELDRACAAAFTATIEALGRRDAALDAVSDRLSREATDAG